MPERGPVDALAEELRFLHELAHKPTMPKLQGNAIRVSAGQALAALDVLAARLEAAEERCERLQAEHAALHAIIFKLGRNAI